MTLGDRVESVVSQLTELAVQAHGDKYTHLAVAVIAAAADIAEAWEFTVLGECDAD